MPDQVGPDDEALVLFAGVGAALRRLRQAKGKSHEDVAKAMGTTSPLTVRNWETPSAKPTLTTLDKYLRAIGVTPRDLVDALPRVEAVAEEPGTYDADPVDAAMRAALVVLKRENDRLQVELDAANAELAKRPPAPTDRSTTEAQASLSAVEEEMERRRAAQSSGNRDSDDDPNGPSSTGGVS